MRKFLTVENLTVLGIVLGIIAGIYIPELMLNLKVIGDVFLNLLKMIVIPLIFVSIFISIASLSSSEDLKDLGIKAFLYYVSTTALAVLTGIIITNIIHFDVSNISQSSETIKVNHFTWESFINNLIPSNIFKSFAEGKAIHVIIFSILFAIAVVGLANRKKEIIVKFFDGANDAFLKIARWIIALSPVGVFALIGYVVADKGIGVIISLWQYVVVVLIGIFIHAVINLGLIAYIFGKVNPFKYFKQVREALLIAFSTCSSSATLPVSLEVATEKAKIDKKIAGFILPLGATVNMDGTALYEAVAAVFIASVYGIELSLFQQVLIFITATLAAIGAASIPSAGLVTMTLVFSAVGLPLEGIALIIAVDRFLDMFRTATNVWGDLIGAKVVARFMNK
ncbi:dicarboxylate/amino acid:cation symporter [Persephonella sp.]|uniref:dicarboxylate/amino acid:cation symporter n=1 Tax=Persephonella sp. TaxID=2060922 RepID=UPI00260E3379|nr:dicarboxylate/amino acid:cation symporter [Persephonella sp.]